MLSIEQVSSHFEANEHERQLLCMRSQRATSASRPR